MMTFVADGQTVGESVSTMFTVLQQGPVGMAVTLRNSGVNVLTYRWQEWTGTLWSDLGASGSPFYNTIMPGGVFSLQVTSSYPQVQLLGNASGGAFLDFSVSRFVQRSSGGPLPIMNL